jgi:tetratricopeptide (TPR) repeat protein
MCRLLSKRLTETAQTLPPRDDKSLYARSLEIDVLVSEGKFEAAENLARAHHANVRAMYGDEGHQTLVAAGVVGETLMRQSKFDAAAQIQREVIAAERRAGRMDKSISLMEAYANTLSHQGKHKDAERLLREALERATRVFGADSEEAMGVVHATAVHMYRMGKYTQATGMHRRALTVQARTLGTEHPTTLNTQMGLSASLFASGSHVEAIGMMRETLDLKTRLVDSNTVVCKINFAYMLGEVGEHAESERLYREVHASRVATLGTDHTDTVNAWRDVVCSLLDQRRYDEALAIEREELAKMRLAGDDVPLMWTKITNIAGILDDTGAHAEAEVMWREVHTHHAAVFGESDQRAINMLSALVQSIWVQTTRNDEAISMQRRLVALSPRGREGEATLQQMVAAHKRATKPSSVTSVSLLSSNKKKRRAQLRRGRVPATPT